MKHKRLNRDGWGFSYYPYYQMRIDDELFHGMACLIKLTDGEANFWETPGAGRVMVTGSGMSWLELVPDNTSRVITVMYFPEGTHDEERHNYPVLSDKRFQPSICYVDITEGIEYDEYGIATYIDKYLDVIFTPEGDVIKIYANFDPVKVDIVISNQPNGKFKLDKESAEEGEILLKIIYNI